MDYGYSARVKRYIIILVRQIAGGLQKLYILRYVGILTFLYPFVFQLG